MIKKIQIRRDIAENWTDANPTLSSGEFGYETDTDRLKLGDGSSDWKSLGYYNPRVSALYIPGGGVESGPIIYTDAGGTVHIDADIVQSGVPYETHAEQLYTTKDLIITRDGAPAGLPVGELSGMQVNLYDGANDLIFGTDSNGYFKVGEPDSLQILATREDNPLGGGVVFYNATQKRMDTNSGFIWEGTTLKVDGNINIDGNSAYKYAEYDALKLATKGDSVTYSSVIIGRNAGDSKTDGTTIRQTAVGYYAGRGNTGNYQVALGYVAGYLNKGDAQTVLGYNAGHSNTGASQIALGYVAGHSNTGASQIALGYYAGQLNTGHRVTGIGHEATRGNTAHDVVAIGYQAGKDNTVANQFIVQQTNVNAVPLIQGDFSSGNVGIAGSLSVGGGLQVDGSSGITITKTIGGETFVWKNGILISCE